MLGAASMNMTALCMGMDNAGLVEKHTKLLSRFSVRDVTTGLMKILLMTARNARAGRSVTSA